MQFKSVLIAAMAAVATAQDPSKVPSCAINCIIEHFPASGCANVLDFPCLCQVGSEYDNTVAACIVGDCPDFNDVLAMYNWQVEACALHGVVWPPA